MNTTTTNFSNQELKISSDEFNRIAQKLLSDPKTDEIYEETMKAIEAEDKGIENVMEKDVPGISEPQSNDVLSEILAEDPDPDDIAVNQMEVLGEFNPNEGFEAPAKTLLELSDQVMRANILKRKYVEATRGVISHICRGLYPKDHYIDYHNVMVIEAGKVPHVTKILEHDFRDGVYR